MGAVMTVQGQVNANELGLVLPHEHIFDNLLAEYRGAGLLNDAELACAELDRYAAAGGRSLVEVTPPEIGRNPSGLRYVSQKTGVHIIMGCGHYRDPYLDRKWFDEMDADAIASHIVSEAQCGVGDTGVMPGIIGEIGCDQWYVSAAEERSFRGAARAHHETGLTITTHAARWPVGLRQLALLLEEGVNTHRIIIGHVDTVPVAGYAIALAKQGCYVQFDGFGTDSEYDWSRAIKCILDLTREGLQGSILISHDIFLRTHLHAHGGAGYDFIPRVLTTRLRAAGLTEQDINQITVVNPRAALTGEVA